MKEILDFLAASPAFHVATADKYGRPHNRPFSFAMEWNGKLTFVTSDTKKVFEQLEKNPYVEISSMNPNGEWMRIYGKVGFTKDEDALKKVFEVMPELKEIYDPEADPSMVCFYIEDGEVLKYGLTSPDPVLLKKL